VVTSVFRTATSRAETIDRLQTSLETVRYAVSVVPPDWHARLPTDQPGLEWLGSWSVAQTLAHLVVYEELVAVPILEAIVTGGDAAAEVATAMERAYDDRWLALSASPVAELLRLLTDARARQVAAIAAIDDARFHALATVLWRDDPSQEGHSAAWVATKTVQHTWEHGNSILQLALFGPLITGL
jgi:hypothetical protein